MVGTGFWRGVLLGVALSALVALGFALAFPPRPGLPPEISPTTEVSPVAPAAPAASTEPSAAPQGAQPLITGAPAPLIETRPSPEETPGVAGDGAAGNPSLAPVQAD